MVREALWAMASRKLDGMAVYGWRSLFDSSGFEHRNPDRAYQYSDPETIRVIRSFSKNVLTPLGPLLRRIPEHRMEVALLESFPATIFAGRGLARLDLRLQRHASLCQSPAGSPL